MLPRLCATEEALDNVQLTSWALEKIQKEYKETGGDNEINGIRVLFSWKGYVVIICVFSSSLLCAVDCSCFRNVFRGKSVCL